MKISRFTLHTEAKTLLVTLDNQQDFSLSYEYLRVIAQWSPFDKKTTLVAHKKQVMLTEIESVGQHGFRFVFDDGFSMVANTELLLNWQQNYQDNWPLYLSALQANHLNREANISIKQL